MFDAVEIGRRISRLRKEKDMTQPALADLMGVSFQAVSNWERGASMPDIGKLPELAQALGVSVDELLGGGRGGELIRSVIAGEEETFVKSERVTLSEAGEAAPLLKPKQVTRIVRAIDDESRQKAEDAQEGKNGESDTNGIDFAALMRIAPFLDEDYLDELAMRLAPKTSMKQLASLAPHLSEETLGKLVNTAIKNGGSLNEIAPLAPFLDEDDLGRIAAEAVKNGGSLSELAAIAPFLDEDDLGKVAASVVSGGAPLNELAAIAPFLDEDDLAKIALTSVQSGGSVSSLTAIAPFLEEDDLDRIVRAALKSGRPVGELTGLFPFLSQETLRALIEEALKKNDTAGLSNLSKYL